MLYPPQFDESVPITVRNTYLLSWVIVLVVVPLLIGFAIAAPQMANLMIPMAAALAVIAVFQVAMVRSGRSTSTGPALAILGWAMLTWAAWQTGGMHSPALYGQFVLVVLAEMCNGWRWGMVSLSLSTLTLAMFTWAEIAGVEPPTIIVMSPALFAAIVAAHLILFGLLAAVLVERMQAMHSDVSRELAERRAAEQRLLEVVDNAPFGAFICAESERGLIITHANPTGSIILDVALDKLIGGRAEDAFPTAGSSDMLAQFHRIAEHGGTHDVGALPYFSEGEHRVLDVHAFDIGGGSVAAFFSDVTDRRVAEAEVNRMAFHDGLTELPNRAMLGGCLDSALVSATEHGRQVALLFLDLDEFKLINDEHGHAVGDQLLIAVAQRLQSCARSTDTVCRLGGDEFAMIIADMEGREQAERIARDAVAALREPFMIEGRTMHVSASVGVSMTSNQDRTLASLLEHGDAAMYRAKRAGRNGYRLYWDGAA
jgi:diguanylate cyclase (GGDEF)-like protein